MSMPQLLVKVCINYWEYAQMANLWINYKKNLPGSQTTGMVSYLPGWCKPQAEKTGEPLEDATNVWIVTTGCVPSAVSRIQIWTSCSKLRCWSRSLCESLSSNECLVKNTLWGFLARNSTKTVSDLNLNIGSFKDIWSFLCYINPRKSQLCFADSWGASKKPQLCAQVRSRKAEDQGVGTSTRSDPSQQHWDEGRVRERSETLSRFWRRCVCCNKHERFMKMLDFLKEVLIIYSYVFYWGMETFWC